MLTEYPEEVIWAQIVKNEFIYLTNIKRKTGTFISTRTIVHLRPKAVHWIIRNTDFENSSTQMRWNGSEGIPCALKRDSPVISALFVLIIIRADVILDHVMETISSFYEHAG